MTIGEKLFALRKEKGLTAKEAATQAGTSESTMLRMEKGKTQPKSPEMIDAFAKLYGCTAKELTDDSVDINKEETEKIPKKKVVQITSHGKTMSAVAKDPEKTASDIDKLDELRKELIEKDAMKEGAAALDPSKEEPAPDEKKTNKSNAKESLSFGMRLSNLRKEKGLSLTQISDAVGIKKGAYQGMEYKNSRPRDIKVYDKLAEVLGCEVSYLTDGDERFSPQKDAPTDQDVPQNSEPVPFGKRLSALRKAKNLTLAQVADKIGVTLNTYKGMEYKSVRPADVRTYNKLAKVLGCDVGYLKEGDKRFEKKSKATSKKDDAKKVPTEAPVVEIKPAPEKMTEHKEPEVPTEAPEKKVAPVKDEIVTEQNTESQTDLEQSIPEEAVVSIEKSSATSEVIKLVSRLSVLLAGDEISQSEKDAVMVALNGAYWR